MSIPASASPATENERIAFVTTAPKEADFECSFTAIYLQATEDCHIAVDRAANSGDFLIKKNEFCHLEKVQGTRISAIGDSTNGTLYIMVSRAAK